MIFTKKQLAWTTLGGVGGVAIIVGIFYFLSRPHSDILVTKQSGSLIALSSVEIVSPVINTQRNTVQYYEKGTGKVYEAHPDGRTPTILSSNRLPDFLSSVWAPNAQAVISSFSSSGGTQFRTFNFITKNSVTLPEGTQSATFSPDSSHIALFKTSSGESEGGVFLTDASGRGLKKIFSTRATNGSVEWPRSDCIAFTSWKSPELQTDIFLLDLRGGITHLLDKQKNVEQLWAKSGKRLLISLENEEGRSELWVRDFETGTFSILPLATPASHCAWTASENTLFCALTTSVGSSDSFYALNLSDGSMKKITVPNKE
jgi:hypothetical protein